LTLTLDRVILHTSCIGSRPLIHTKFNWSRRNFLWIDVRTDGRTFETGFVRSTRRSRSNKTYRESIQMHTTTAGI